MIAFEYHKIGKSRYIFTIYFNTIWRELTSSNEKNYFQLAMTANFHIFKQLKDFFFT